MNWWLVVLLGLSHPSEYSVRVIGPLTQHQCRLPNLGMCLSDEQFERLASRCQLSGPLVNASKPYPPTAKDSTWRCERPIRRPA
jgi:hypothetical protein